MLFLKIPFLYTLLVPSLQKTKDEPRMKKCLGWHFEYCARGVPTLRNKRNTLNRKKRTPNHPKSTFVKITVSFTSLIPSLKTPTDDREMTDRTPRNPKVLFVNICFPNRVTYFPKKVDSFSKKVD